MVKAKLSKSPQRRWTLMRYSIDGWVNIWQHIETLDSSTKVNSRTEQFIHKKNSRELKEIIQDWRVNRKSWNLSQLWCKNLYLSIPIGNALDLVDTLLKGIPNIKEMTNLSFRSGMKLLQWLLTPIVSMIGRYFNLDSGSIQLVVTGEIPLLYISLKSWAPQCTITWNNIICIRRTTRIYYNRSRSQTDYQLYQDELQNVVDVLLANVFTRDKVNAYMKEKRERIPERLRRGEMQGSSSHFVSERTGWKV